MYSYTSCISPIFPPNDYQQALPKFSQLDTCTANTSTCGVQLQFFLSRDTLKDFTNIFLFSNSSLSFFSIWCAIFVSRKKLHVCMYAFHPSNIFLIIYFFIKQLYNMESIWNYFDFYTPINYCSKETHRQDCWKSLGWAFIKLRNNSRNLLRKKYNQTISHRQISERKTAIDKMHFAVLVFSAQNCKTQARRKDTKKSSPIKAYEREDKIVVQL